MAKKKTKKSTSKISKAKNLAGALAFLQSGGKGMFGGMGQVLGTGRRASITGKAVNMPGHEPPIQYASLQGGKKLVMFGKDKGKII